MPLEFKTKDHNFKTLSIATFSGLLTVVVAHGTTNSSLATIIIFIIYSICVYCDVKVTHSADRNKNTHHEQLNKKYNDNNNNLSQSSWSNSKSSRLRESDPYYNYSGYTQPSAPLPSYQEYTTLPAATAQ
jgi:hypothetical protein